MLVISLRFSLLFFTPLFFTRNHSRNVFFPAFRGLITHILFGKREREKKHKSDKGIDHYRGNTERWNARKKGGTQLYTQSSYLIKEFGFGGEIFLYQRTKELLCIIFRYRSSKKELKGLLPKILLLLRSRRFWNTRTHSLK